MRFSASNQATLLRGRYVIMNLMCRRAPIIHTRMPRIREYMHAIMFWPSRAVLYALAYSQVSNTRKTQLVSSTVNGVYQPRAYLNVKFIPSGFIMPAPLAVLGPNWIFLVLETSCKRCRRSSLKGGTAKQTSRSDLKITSRNIIDGNRRKCAYL